MSPALTPAQRGAGQRVSAEVQTGERQWTCKVCGATGTGLTARSRRAGWENHYAEQHQGD